MFIELAKQQVFWQSEDGLVHSGMGCLDNQTVNYSYLGNRLLQLQDIEHLIHCIRDMDGQHPLLLLSSCPGFEPNVLSEERGLIFFVGHYRRCQQEWRDNGHILVSAIDTIAVGGTYLMHGMAAPTRLATEGTEFHGALPPDARAAVMGDDMLRWAEPDNSLLQALDMDLITDIVERRFLPDALRIALGSE